jgi:hypothetical protein
MINDWLYVLLNQRSYELVKKKKKPPIVLLTIEAKYMVVFQVESEAIWIKRFFGELGFA